MMAWWLQQEGLPRGFVERKPMICCCRLSPPEPSKKGLFWGYSWNQVAWLSIGMCTRYLCLLPLDLFHVWVSLSRRPPLQGLSPSCVQGVHICDPGTQEPEAGESS